MKGRLGHPKVSFTVSREEAPQDSGALDREDRSPQPNELREVSTISRDPTLSLKSPFSFVLFSEEVYFFL